LQAWPATVAHSRSRIARSSGLNGIGAGALTGPRIGRQEPRREPTGAGRAPTSPGRAARPRA
jgi:hypothetical protein